MSSHREAPEISKDPVADNTDVYAFISPDRPDTVTLIANYVPLQAPAGGPNFYEFGDDVQYSIHTDNNPDRVPHQHGPDPGADPAELNPQAFLPRPPSRRRRPPTAARSAPAVPAVQH